MIFSLHLKASESETESFGTEYTEIQSEFTELKNCRRITNHGILAAKMRKNCQGSGLSLLCAYRRDGEFRRVQRILVHFCGQAAWKCLLKSARNFRPLPL